MNVGLLFVIWAARNLEEEEERRFDGQSRGERGTEREGEIVPGSGVAGEKAHFSYVLIVI